MNFYILLPYQFSILILVRILIYHEYNGDRTVSIAWMHCMPTYILQPIPSCSARQAVKMAADDGSVVLRIKRKRTEDPLDALRKENN